MIRFSFGSEWYSFVFYRMNLNAGFTVNQNIIKIARSCSFFYCVTKQIWNCRDGFSLYALSWRTSGTNTLFLTPADNVQYHKKDSQCILESFSTFPYREISKCNTTSGIHACCSVLRSLDRVLLPSSTVTESREASVYVQFIHRRRKRWRGSEETWGEGTKREESLNPNLYHVMKLP